MRRPRGSSTRSKFIITYLLRSRSSVIIPISITRSSSPPLLLRRFALYYFLFCIVCRVDMHYTAGKAVEGFSRIISRPGSSSPPPSSCSCSCSKTMTQRKKMRATMRESSSSSRACSARTSSPFRGSTRSSSPFRGSTRSSSTRRSSSSCCCLLRGLSSCLLRGLEVVVSLVARQGATEATTLSTRSSRPRRPCRPCRPCRLRANCRRRGRGTSTLTPRPHVSPSTRARSVT